MLPQLLTLNLALLLLFPLNASVDAREKTRFRPLAAIHHRVKAIQGPLVRPRMVRERQRCRAGDCPQPSLLAPEPEPVPQAGL